MRQVTPGGPFRRVLVAWDGSAHSAAALRMAAAIVGAGPGHVVALAICPPSVRRRRGWTTRARNQRTRGGYREGFARARDSIAETSQARIGLHVEEGRHAARSLCAYAY